MFALVTLKGLTVSPPAWTEMRMKATKPKVEKVEPGGQKSPPPPPLRPPRSQQLNMGCRSGGMWGSAGLPPGFGSGRKSKKDSRCESGPFCTGRIGGQVLLLNSDNKEKLYKGKISTMFLPSCHWPLVTGANLTWTFFNPHWTLGALTKRLKTKRPKGRNVTEA